MLNSFYLITNFQNKSCYTTLVVINRVYLFFDLFLGKRELMDFLIYSFYELMDLQIVSGFQSLEVNVNFDLQIVPALASGSASKVTCHFDRTLLIFDSFFAFWHTVSYVYLVKIFLQAWNQPFLQKVCFLLVGNAIQILLAGYLRCSLLLGCHCF